VIEEMITGLNLVVAASMIACSICRPRFIFSFILSTKNIAILTTIPIKEINHIINGILYGLPVTYIPILAPSKAVRIEYKIINGFPNELNSNTKIAKTRNNANHKAEKVACISSLFASFSHHTRYPIPLGY
jgi:hypothetical protein